MHVSLFVDFKLPVAGRVYGFVAQFGTAEDWQPVCGLSLQYICLQTGGLNLCRLAAATLGRKISLIKILIIRQKHKNIVKTPLGKKDQNSLLTVFAIFFILCAEVQTIMGKHLKKRSSPALKTLYLCTIKFATPFNFPFPSIHFLNPLGPLLGFPEVIAATSW